MVKKRTKTSLSIKKRKRKVDVDILSPKVLNAEKVGETIAYEPERVIGRELKLNLGNLLRKAELRNKDVILKITKVEGTKAYSEIKGIQTKESFLKRIIRRRTTKIDVIERFYSKDGKKVKVKAYAIAYRKVDREKRTAIRKKIENLFKENEINTIFRKVIYEKLGEKIKELSQKITPTKYGDIIEITIESKMV